MHTFEYAITNLFAWAEAPRLSRSTLILLATILIGLGVTYLIGVLIRRQPDSTMNPAIVQAFNSRVRAWWLMFVILTAAFLLGNTATVILFFLISFWALREFITLTPTRMGDHRTLFWIFFLFAPLQYILIAWGNDFYGLYSIVIPVYVYLFIPARIALAGDYKRFLERAAKIQAGILICVYALSYAPALLYLNYQTTAKEPWLGSSAGVLLYLILIVQIGDAMQYVWSRYLGKRPIAPAINSSRTWEGFFGGTLTTTLVGAVLFFVTPFNPWESAFLAMITAVMGFAGGMTMSAIKRDRGVKDYGTLVEGHAGILDRIDSLCFAAPVFFHLTRFWFTDAVAI
ncbi:MAG: phosphatidate cytidylyltransferase [Planctomycetaceae bacterium]|nr:phosphatidate cytidylyltransferase [Planctomycetaceae bacterium]